MVLQFFLYQFLVTVCQKILLIAHILFQFVIYLLYFSDQTFVCWSWMVKYNIKSIVLVLFWVHVCYIIALIPESIHICHMKRLDLPFLFLLQSVKCTYDVFFWVNIFFMIDEWNLNTNICSCWIITIALFLIFLFTAIDQ